MSLPTIATSPARRNPRPSRTAAPRRRGATTPSKSAPPSTQPAETPSAVAVRELREWYERHRSAGRSEVREHETRANIDDGLAAFMAREAVGHLLGALDLGRHLASAALPSGPVGASASFSPSSSVSNETEHYRRPPSLRFTFGEAYDLPRELPAIGMSPGRWRALATRLDDFSVVSQRPQYRGQEDVLDDAADRIMALGHWPSCADVSAALAAALASKGGAR
jgi:hypothetical protein